MIGTIYDHLIQPGRMMGIWNDEMHKFPTVSPHLVFSGETEGQQQDNCCLQHCPAQNPVG